MASRRITNKEEDGYLLEEEQRSSSPKNSSHPKNSMVVCVVFFNVLAAHARSLTLHVWKTAHKKEFLLHMILPLLILVMIPLFVLQHVPSTHVGSQINIVWTALLHFSTWPIVLLCGGVVVHHYSTPTPTKSLVFKTCLLITLLAVLIIVNCQIQVIYPSWIWNPFLWGRYPIYLPSALLPAMQGICLTQDPNNTHPLCLKESSWKTLSAGVLSSKRKQDVEAVTRGIAYAREESGGLVVNVMSRDTVDAIPALQQNVEALVPFFQKVTVVVFENDSTDGSREAFSEWSKRASGGYAVDLMDCGPDNFDCKFGISHRYDAKEASHYFQSSAIGKMADYRQRMVDYILDKYPTYSHMIVVDLDLQVSLSPFGILHSLGTHPEAAVASSGRQVWPGSMGTLIPPYDFSAFRTSSSNSISQKDEHLHKLHDAFCGLLPPGDRWRNQCDAASSIHLLFVLQHDVLLKEEPYKVASAFNGATLYPINVMKQTHAKYDTGEDGQRCEHIGFNLAFPSFYINPKWNFHVMPTNPGGPTGLRSVKNVVRIVFKPKLSLIIFAQLMVFLVAFVASCMVLWNHLAQVVVDVVALASWKSVKQTEEMQMELPMTLAHVHVLQDDYKKLKTVHKRNHSSPKSSPGRA